ncbi:unnamed protein product [Rhizoctonia solani]|uniref:Uncharacterized protein n=1 Tax=Rhizoctonia solani TaxID=456999 RepID=A0A8H2ZX42_9AGAM|nr:unnamed protein product [Rhizoctonia solani]
MPTSTSKPKPPTTTKPKESAESKAEKRKRTTEHKAAKAAVLAKVNIADSDEESQPGGEGKGEKERDDQESEEPEGEKWYRSKCGKYVYIRDNNNEYTRWTIKSKPNIKEAGKNWSVAKYMELDGNNEKSDMYNAINTYARTILMAEVKDLENPIWGNVTTDMRNRLNFRLKKRFPYLHRFKDNCVSEELCKRILRNHRDTMSRIKKAGGRTEWKAQEKVKREARKAKAVLSSKAKSASDSAIHLSTQVLALASTGPSSEGPVPQRTVPPTDDDEDHGVFSDNKNPRKKRRWIIDDSDDSESPSPPAPRQSDSDVAAASSSKKRQLTPEGIQDRCNATISGNAKRFVSSSNRPSQRARNMNSEAESEKDGDKAVMDIGGSKDNSGGNKGKESEDHSEGEGDNKVQADKDDEGQVDKDDDDDDEEDLARQMEELKKRMNAASNKKNQKRDPLPTIPVQKQQCPLVDNLPSRSSTPALNPSTAPTSNSLAPIPQPDSTITSNTPSSNYGKPQSATPSPKRPRVRPKIRPVPLDSDSEIIVKSKEQPASSIEPTGRKNAVRPSQGPRSRKMKEELIESVESGLNAPKKNTRRQLRAGR